MNAPFLCMYPEPLLIDLGSINLNNNYNKKKCMSSAQMWIAPEQLLHATDDKEFFKRAHPLMSILLAH